MAEPKHLVYRLSATGITCETAIYKAVSATGIYFLGYYVERDLKGVQGPPRNISAALLQVISRNLIIGFLSFGKDLGREE